jgi:acyl carrier protein
MPDTEGLILATMAKVLKVPLQEISPDVSRKNFATWDSLKHMNLMLALEDEFQIEFSDREIAEIDSLAALVNCVRAKCP